MSPSENNIPAPEEKRPPGWNIPSIIKRIMLFIVLLPVLGLALLQLRPVQIWLKDTISAYISDRTQMQVEISEVRLSLIDGLKLMDVKIHEAQDSLFQMREFDISLRKNLLYIFNKKLDLSSIKVKGLKLNILTKEGAEKSNLDQFISRLAGKSNNSSRGKPLHLDLKRLNLEDILLILDNENQGKSINFALDKGSFLLRNIDLECNSFDIESILLERLQITSIKYDSTKAIHETAKANVISQNSSEAQSGSNPLQLKVGSFRVSDASVSVHNNLTLPDLTYKDVMDFNHFNVSGLDIGIEHFRLDEDQSIGMDLKQFRFRDDKGFVLQNFTCDSIVINAQEILLPDYELITERSRLRKKIHLSYDGWGAFSNFLHDVIINTEFEDSKIFLGDITHFIKALKGNKLLIHNSKEELWISGRYFGRINNIAGRDVNIRLGDKLALAGSFNTRDLTDPGNTLLNIRLDRFQTSMRKLRMVFPGMNLPDNFAKTGSINFTGRFDGYPEDFVAYGKLRTDIGTAELDMRLDLSAGTQKANYSGQLNLIQFNLGKWADNPDLGLVNFNSRVQNGRGLTLNTLRTDLTATVKSLYFKNYNYTNFVVQGLIEKSIFKGTLSIHDPNIDFEFKGVLEYLEGMAFLNFESEVKRIDLKALNLSKNPLAFAGDMQINLQGSNINDILGDIEITDMVIEKDDSLYTLERINLDSKILASKSKQLIVTSDLGRMSIEGDYDLPNLAKSVKKILATNYPYITKTWELGDTKDFPNQRVNLDIQLQQSKNLLDLAGLKNVYFSRLNLKGRIDSYRNEISLSTTLPLLKIKNDSIKNIQVLVTSDAKTGDIFIHADSTFAAGTSFKAIDFQTNMKGDTITAGISSSDVFNIFENFDIQGRFIPHARGYELSLKENQLKFFNQNWSISKGNKIILGKNYFDIQNLSFSDGSRRLLFRDIENKGLNIILTRFDLDMLNPVIDYDKMKFGGLTDVDIEISDLFGEHRDISVIGYVQEFTINKDPYGTLNLYLTQPAGEKLNASITLGDIIAAKVDYSPEGKQLNARAKLKRAPLYILQYLLKDGITNTAGYADAEINVNGPLSDLKINGSGTINKGRTKLIYTGATYYFDNQKVKLNERVIDLTGAVIKDANGNSGTITGGLTHNVFKDFGVNATLTGNNVIVLNTTKSDNANYYGYGVGNVTARFTGSFENVDMVITGVTGPGSKLFIPVGNTQASAEESFITFFKKDSVQSNNTEYTESTIKGINIEVNLTLTPDAELSIIFDESRGDIIRGNGRGNMQITITRKGDFDIFGEYQIESGEYLFTVALLPVAKPFVVSRGGIIRWTGDPINTTLDIEANYRMRTAVKPFIEEYLVLSGAETVNQANQRTEVDLKLKLGGTLYKPEIKFDLAFPNLVGELANLTDSKMRLIRINELELNSQVLGLIVFNSFLPSNRVSDAFGAGSLQSAGINTLSEFVSSQLSMYLTSLLNTALEENGFIAGVDFEVGLRNNTLNVGGATDNRNLFPDEVEFMLKNRFRFMDERLSLNVGGNYVFQNQGFTVNQILPDFSLELILTKDRKLKARLYGKYDLDAVAINNFRQKYGLGLGYRTEFGSMLDFEKNVKKGVRELLENK
jgi:hypothetical protein